MTTIVVAQIQQRAATAAQWTTKNPVLLQGEYGFESDTKKQKVGDGVTAWNSLSYHYDPNDSGVGAAIAAHEAAANPHPVYLTQVEGDAAYAPLSHAHSGVYEPASANLQAHLLRTDNPHAVTAAQVGADASGTATTAIAAHASATGVHSIAGVTGLQTALDNKSATTHNHDSAYALISNGVTGGNSHDHNGGGGAQIAYAGLSGLPTLGSAAAQNTTAFEASGAVATHAALTQAHGISSFFAGVVSAIDAAAALIALGVYNLASRLKIQLSTEQLRLGYDASNYAAFTVNSDGSITKTVANASGSASWYLSADGSLWTEIAGQTVGNARGAASFDVQGTRNAATKVASGANAFAFGSNCTASGSNAIAIGSNCTVSGSNAIALGNGAIATGISAYALGQSCTSSGNYSVSFGLSGQSTASYAASFGAYARNAINASDVVSGSTVTYPGVHQMGRIPLGVITTDATPAVLNITSTVSTRPVLSAKAVWFFRVHLVAYTSTGTYRVAAWEITGVIARDNSNNTRIVETPTVTQIVNESSWITTQPTVTADDTNEAVAITVTGLAATTIRWTGGAYYTQALAA